MGSDSRESGHVEPTREATESGGLFAGIRKVINWVKDKVGSIFSDAERPAEPVAETVAEKSSPLAPELSTKLKSQVKKVVDDIAALLKSETLQDKADIRILTDARSFIENPTEKLEDITKHSTDVGQVLGGYDQQGIDAPTAIDALNRYLLTLICVNRIKYIEEAIEKGTAASPEVKYAMKMADDRATLLSRGYKDDTLLAATKKLQERLK
jgi:hypothetical protein